MTQQRKTGTMSLNAVTDTGVLFGIGNALALSNISTSAAITNVVMSAICFGVRLTSEFQKSGTNIKAPQIIKKLASNPGAAIGVCGLFNLTAAALAAANQSVAWSKPETLIPAAIMTAFGVASCSWSIASALKQESFKQKLINSFGTCAAIIGLYIATPNAELASQTLYAAAALTAIVLTARSKNPYGILWQPFLLIAAANTLNATNSATGAMIAANLVWAGAYISLDALNKNGGIAETIGSFFRKGKSDVPQ